MKKPKKNKSSFHPDTAATTLHQAFRLDLECMPHPTLYRGMTSFEVKDTMYDSFIKKYPFQDQQTSLDLDALTRDLFINNLLRMEFFNRNNPFGTELNFSEPSWTWDRHTLALERASGIISSTLGDITEEEIFSACRHSAGVTIGTKYVNSSIFAKMTYPITGTVTMIRCFNRYLKWDPQLEIALVDLNERSESPRFDVVDGSRHSMVPKDNSKNRSIAIEPTLNMFFQQGLMAVLIERLSKVGLNLETLQEEHKDLALEGSLTCSNATIDFSAASDSLSLSLVEFLLPPKWFELLSSARCSNMTFGEHELSLPIFSTMGNAVTFPLETLIFWALGLAAVAETENVSKRSVFIEPDVLKTVSVFGDDLILPRAAVPFGLALFGKCGLVINEEKSFYKEEYFRESCGGDFFAYHDVRPYFLTPPDDNRKSTIESWLYVTFNAMQTKYISYFGHRNYVYHTNLFQVVLSLINSLGFKIKIVPSCFPDGSGIRDPDPRLILGLKAEYAPLFVNKHGLVKFNYLTFRYRGDDVVSSDTLSYWKTLKSFPSSKSPSVMAWQRLKKAKAAMSTYRRKERGGWNVTIGYGSIEFAQQLSALVRPWSSNGSPVKTR